MFKNLTNYSYVRATKEAIGFYIAYFVGIVVAAMIAGGALGIALDKANDIGFSIRMGTMIAVVSCFGVSAYIAKVKDLTGDLKYILLVIFSGVFAVVGGALLGLVPTAILTTVPVGGAKTEEAKEEETSTPA